MEFDLFEQLLLKAQLNKKQFAELVSMNYNSVTNWKGTSSVPDWVESWLNLYIENKSCKDLKKMLQDSGVCN